MQEPEFSQLEKRRLQIISEIKEIESMRRGTLNEIYRKQELKSGAVAKRGPFYNITTKGKANKTITVAVPRKDAVRVRKEIDDYKRFRLLCEEYIDVCEAIALLSENDSKA